MRNRNGFTMVELLVVMGIILVLMAIALPAVNAARNKAKNTEVKAGCNTIQKALEQFAVDNGGGYPGAHYVTSSGTLFGGPGVIGGLPTYDGPSPRKDFYVAKQAGDLRGPGNASPELAPSVPNPNVIDALVAGGYLTDYPANPFLRASSGVKSQMSNLMLFNPGTATFPVSANSSTVDWNRYTGAGQSMRREYDEVGRGHFTYIPLNPINNTSTNFEANWTALQAPAQSNIRSQFYKRCRGYLLVGWGSSRADDSEAKGLSEKFWRSDLNGFDIDADGKLDLIERMFSNETAAWLTPEVLDSSGSAGAFNAASIVAGRDIDQLFNGATFVKIAGS